MKSLTLPLAYRWSAVAVVICSTVIHTTSELRAQDLTPQALDLLQKKCQECHHPDTQDDFPYLHQEVTIQELVENEALVPGKPDESSILARVLLADDDKDRMPRSRGAVGEDKHRPPLTADEKKLLKDWIFQLGEQPPANMSAAPGTPAAPDASTTPEKPSDTSAAPVEPVAVIDDPEKLPVNAPLTQQVHWILDKRCSTCHTGDYEPTLDSSTNLGMFLSDKDTAGISAAENLYNFVTLAEGEPLRMPFKRAALPAEEIAVLKKWLDTAPPAAAARPFVSHRDVLDVIYKDLSDARETERRFYRYLTLTHLHNETDSRGDSTIPELNPHRAAISKMINSLSTNARITRPKAVDEHETVYRLDLRDYNWTAADWERVLSYYPYGLVGVDRQKESLIERESGTPMSYIRGDWFVFASSQPPLYDEILYSKLNIPYHQDDQSDVLAKLEHALGVNRKHNLQQGQAMRAGFMLSGVSQANRLIERHALGTHQGSYWVSYDFTPQAAGRTQDLKLSPLGPPDMGLTHNKAHAFQHDGGEMVYSLPNGLQGYMLTNHDGKRLDRGPVEIVQDSARPDGVIINGISCIACHDSGIKPAIKVADFRARSLSGIKDEIRPLVEQAGILDFQERRLLEQLYVEPEVLQAAVKEDAERFARANAEATSGLADSTEPVKGLYNHFKGHVNGRRLASEFGLTYDELNKLLAHESRNSETLYMIASNLSSGNAERRENILREYISVAFALGYQLRPFIPLGYEEFGGKRYAELILSDDIYIAAMKGANLPIAQAKHELLTSTTTSAALAQETVLLPGGGKLKLSIQPDLKVGQRANLEIVATQDTHIRVLHLSADHHVTELFPGSTGKSSARPKNNKLQVSWQTTAPGGVEQVMVIAAETPLSNHAHGGITAGDFTVFSKDAIFASTRGVPTAVRAEETTDAKGVPTGIPAKLTQAKISYHLRD